MESLDRFKTSNGLGCILAHSMGLGKTLQLISFVDIFLRQTGAKSVLIIVPVNTLQNWVSEFNMWLPVASAVTGVPESDGSKPTADAPAQSNVSTLDAPATQGSTSTGDSGQTARDTSSGSASAPLADVSMVTDSANHFTNSMSSASGSWFGNPMVPNATSGGFMNSLPPDYSYSPVNPISSESPDQPMSSATSGSANYSELMNPPSNSMASESSVAPGCDDKSSMPLGCEEKLSAVPEIDRELFWPREFKLYIVNDNLKTNVARAKVVGEFRDN